MSIPVRLPGEIGIPFHWDVGLWLFVLQSGSIPMAIRELSTTEMITNVKGCLDSGQQTRPYNILAIFIFQEFFTGNGLESL